MIDNEVPAEPTENPPTEDAMPRLNRKARRAFTSCKRRGMSDHEALGRVLSTYHPR